MSSLKKIASELGVSYTLVSKVLSGRMSTTVVSAQKREAILAKARELDYTPNRLAVALKAGRKGAVGIFVHQMGTPGSDVSERLLRGLADGLEQSGLRMWLRFFMTDKEFLAACDTKLKSEVDGLIVAGVGHPELAPKFRDLEKEKVPIVSVFSVEAQATLSGNTNVAVDYHQQTYLATRHLLESGCKKLALVDTIKSRTQGFLQAHEEAGLKHDPKLVYSTTLFARVEGERALEMLVRKKLKFDGVVCQSDTQALGVINGLTRLGIKVPDEVKVTGIDNSPISVDCIVPITSVSSEMRTAALHAVELLLKKIEGESVSSLKIQPRLVIRESSVKGAGEGDSKKNSG
jgi:LacI family transcriptional regulator